MTILPYTDGKITITAVDYHRNGVSGEGFHAFTSTNTDYPELTFVGTVFAHERYEDGPSRGEPRWDAYIRQAWTNPMVAIYAIERLPQVEHNAWRGDHWASAIYGCLHAMQESHWVEMEIRQSARDIKANLAALRS